MSRKATPGVWFFGVGVWLAGLAAGWAAAWPQFRGPQAAGVAAGSFPTVFGPKTNVLWVVEVPAGHSSPCIWEDYLFLTATEGERLLTLCYNRRDGRELWRQGVVPEKPERGMGAMASPTPATDGRRVYVYFGAFGLVSYDFAGKEIWRRPLPTPVTQHGAGASPVVANGVVVINRDADVDAHLLAVSAEDGRTLWDVKRPEARRGFATPLLWPAHQPELVILPGTLQLAAYRLKDGAAVWRARGLPNEMVASPIFGEGLFFAAGWTPGAGMPVLPGFDELLAQGDQDKDGRLTREEAPQGTARRDFTYVDADKDGFLTRSEWESIRAIYEKSENALLAVRPGGEGDVTATHVAWKQNRGLPYVPTPLYYEGRVYLVKNGGLFSCFEARTGRALYQEERLGALGDYYASPVAAGGKILVCSQAGMAVVIKAGDTLEVLARNPMGERIMATPAIVDNVLYLRTQGRLYALGEPRE
ncbi:MAG: PQQ-binding-like beta-propeller repeat protein [Verrucomicrobiae bacterium]|nr:PQQ-binding-like beta-propeller repeat protein [Verrucomicrobiae bacterium]